MLLFFCSQAPSVAGVETYSWNIYFIQDLTMLYNTLQASDLCETEQGDGQTSAEAKWHA